MGTFKSNRLSCPALKPRKCNHCGSKDIGVVEQKKLFGKNVNKWPFVWYCATCRASVGCHPNTELPMGIMADRRTRRIRHKAHMILDPIWRHSKWLTRRAMYEWVARNMGLSGHACHISWFNYEQCEALIELCEGTKPKKKHFKF